MQISPSATSRKGRITLSIDRELLKRLEPFKQHVNLSAQAESMISEMLDRLENLAWVERNHEALIDYGKRIAKRGLAGAEFERI